MLGLEEKAARAFILEKERKAYSERRRRLLKIGPWARRTSKRDFVWDRGRRRLRISSGRLMKKDSERKGRNSLNSSNSSKKVGGLGSRKRSVRSLLRDRSKGEGKKRLV